MVSLGLGAYNTIAAVRYLARGWKAWFLTTSYLQGPLAGVPDRRWWATGLHNQPFRPFAAAIRYTELMQPTHPHYLQGQATHPYSSRARSSWQHCSWPAAKQGVVTRRRCAQTQWSLSAAPTGSNMTICVRLRGVGQPSRATAHAKSAKVSRLCAGTVFDGCEPCWGQAATSRNSHVLVVAVGAASSGPNFPALTTLVGW